MTGHAQILPRTRPFPGRGHELQPGERFGELAVVGFVGPTPQGHRWLMQCDCGRYATRLGAYLIRRRHDGGSSCCSECATELRGGLFESGRQGRRDAYRKCWESSRSLYGLEYTHREASGIWDDLVGLGMATHEEAADANLARPPWDRIKVAESDYETGSIPTPTEAAIEPEPRLEPWHIRPEARRSLGVRVEPTKHADGSTSFKGAE